MQRGDFPCPEGRPYLHVEWQSKGPFLPSAGEEKRKKEIKMRIVAVFLTFYFAIVAFCRTLTFPLQANKE